MQEEIELEVNKNYIVPLSEGRKLLIGRQDDGYRPGAGIMLIDRNGDIEDLVLAEEDNSTFGCSAIHLHMWGNIYDEDPTHEEVIKRSDIEDMERDNGYVPLKKYKVWVTKRADVEGEAIVMAEDENDAKEKARDLTFNQFQWDDDNCDCDIIPLDAEEIEEA